MHAVKQGCLDLLTELMLKRAVLINYRLLSGVAVFFHREVTSFPFFFLSPSSPITLNSDRLIPINFILGQDFPRSVCRK